MDRSRGGAALAVGNVPGPRRGRHEHGERRRTRVSKRAETSPDATAGTGVLTAKDGVKVALHDDDIGPIDLKFFGEIIGNDVFAPRPTSACFETIVTTPSVPMWMKLLGINATSPTEVSVSSPTASADEDFSTQPRTKAPPAKEETTRNRRRLRPSADIGSIWASHTGMTT